MSEQGKQEHETSRHPQRRLRGNLRERERRACEHYFLGSKRILRSP